MRTIHQKNCELPIAATGAAASATKTTQMTERIALNRLNFFFPFSINNTLSYLAK
ncbi:hypothetical protein LLCRE1631_01209 [Lactococcus lactis subsp. lactis CNCM I-1631]|nr:hypothetical protein LLCRE1631_01209 [Lactococcus lactis subsp. lactis CNCM I-1631]